MRRTRIKICGITRPQDALAAANTGADAIGLVFYPPAARCVSVARAREILAVLPPFITPVGLFVNQPAEEIKTTADALGLNCVQLHGEESPADATALAPLRILKAVRVDARFRQSLALWKTARVSGLVLETAGSTGGTGVTNDWDAIESARHAGAFDGLPPIILAGGLTAENVGGGVRRLRPWAVDVSSGVESAKGIKSADKIAAFVAAASGPIPST